MPTLPSDEWTAALDRMNAVLEGQLADLDRRQSTEAAVATAPAPAARPEELLEWMEHRLDQWNQRLTDSAGLAAAVEQQLGERESALGRWHDHFVRWRELIQRTVDPAGRSPGSHRSG